MNSSDSFLGLTVGDYFNSCNWQLVPPPINNYVLPQHAKITCPQRSIILSRLTVEEFFNSCNWQMLPQIEPDEGDYSISTLPQLQAEKDAFPNPSTALPCLTVTEFFSLCNWHCLPIEVRQTQLLPLEQKPHLTWQVQAFLQIIPWEGSPDIGSLPQPSTLSKSISSAQVEMSLNNLSKLF
ncbi:hypothetical protein [Synechocystis sp. PCC 7509]|uniref:hypothetical protein n=1 Tax=Synechocystis sp. PCC 7509 TaxID=927677 RepID=UPI0002ABE5DE|nr:hypothetical protein [Synechocystis sp. PCC 7509]